MNKKYMFVVEDSGWFELDLPDDEAAIEYAVEREHETNTPCSVYDQQGNQLGENK